MKTKKIFNKSKKVVSLKKRNNLVGFKKTKRQTSKKTTKRMRGGGGPDRSIVIFDKDIEKMDTLYEYTYTKDRCSRNFLKKYTGQKIKNGEMNFEKLICSSSMMIKLSKLGKVLGPKGLMPNPKLGTVTDKIGEAVKNAKAGQVELKNDKDGNIGLSIGKKSFSDDKLIKNFNAVITSLEKEKSNLTIKGDLIKSTYITSTMGVSYKIKLEKSF